MGSFNVFSMKPTERRYTNRSVYNGRIQICKEPEICILFRIHDFLSQGMVICYSTYVE